MVAEAFSLDTAEPRQLAQVKSILKRLIAEGKVVEVFRNDAHREKKKFVEVVKKDNLSQNEVAVVAAVVAKNTCDASVGGLFD